MVLAISLLSFYTRWNLVRASRMWLILGSLLIDISIIGTLAGTSYFGPVAGHGFETHELEELRSERKRQYHENFGKVAGQLAAEKTGDSGDSFVMLKKNEEKDEDKKSNDGKDENKESK